MSAAATQTPTRLVGCCGFGRDATRYFDLFTTVEYQQSFLDPPKAKTLSRLRDQTPAGFVFVIRAWQLITHEVSSPGYQRLTRPLNGGVSDYGHFRDTSAVLDAYRRTVEAAEVLRAQALLFETPTSFTPTAQNRRAMTSFFERVQRGGRLMVWDPRGLWSDGEIAGICTDLQLVPCQDPFSQQIQPGASVAYFKLRGLGGAQHYSDTQLAWLAESTQVYERAFCIFHTVEMLKDASRLLEQIDASTSVPEPS